MTPEEINRTNSKAEANAMVCAWLNTVDTLRRDSIHARISVPLLADMIASALEARDREIERLRTIGNLKD